MRFQTFIQVHLYFIPGPPHGINFLTYKDNLLQFNLLSWQLLLKGFTKYFPQQAVVADGREIADCLMIVEKVFKISFKLWFCPEVHNAASFLVFQYLFECYRLDSNSWQWDLLMWDCRDWLRPSYQWRKAVSSSEFCSTGGKSIHPACCYRITCWINFWFACAFTLLLAEIFLETAILLATHDGQDLGE